MFNSFRRNKNHTPRQQAGETIGEMLIGQEGFTLPWAMMATETPEQGREYWVQPSYPVSSHRTGGNELEIVRVVGGFVTYTSGIEDPVDYTPSNTRYIDLQEHAILRVLEVHGPK